MDELINRVFLETDCPKDQITYAVVDKYKSNKKENELPKTLMIKACGKKLIYINLVNTSLTQVIGDIAWETGTWTLDSVSELEKK